MPDTEGPFSFREILGQELKEVFRSRQLRDGDRQGVPGDDPIAAAHSAQLLGLAFSGGGIRSATFNLGILQSLAELGILRFVDYLSTVSGGGYIGGWLAAWIYRSRFDRVEKELTDSRPAPTQGGAPDPAGFLRQYSNYLTPRLGYLSADTWTIAAVWLRNTLLNFIILAMGLCGVLILPRLLVQLSGILWWPLAETCLATLCLLVAVFFIVRNLRAFATGEPTRAFRARQTGIQLLIVIPVCLAGWLSADRLWVFAQESNMPGAPWVWTPCLIAAGVFFALLFPLGAWGGFLGCYLAEHRPSKEEKWIRLRAWGLVILFALIAAGVGAGLTRVALLVFEGWNRDSAAWNVPSLGTPLMLVVFSCVVILHIGLLGRTFPDEQREWFSRVGAWVSIYVVVWSGLFAVAVYGPLLLASGLHASNAWVSSTFSAGWLATTIGGLLAGRDPRTGDGKGAKEPGISWMNLLAKAGPPVFVAGLLIWLSEAVHLVLSYTTGTTASLFPGAADLIARHWSLMNGPGPVSVAAACVICLGTALLLSLRIDINEFSMHHLYKNRLVRCYLGASNRRRPNPFTGFDTNDDVRLADLAPSRTGYTGPYPILNTALNLVHGEEMAWQERKAASFIFTPLYCGYDVAPEPGQAGRRPILAPHGYRPTLDFAYRDGMHVGTAMAISGAAASPNMGYHSSVPVAFLLTVFNVRLGWWLGNPRHPFRWRDPGPRLGLAALVCELLGFTDDDSNYVYLSDGGHFENLGIYELVKRRCRFIIACDAGQDQELKFEDLGNAIRKCRADFGIDIEIDTARIRRPNGSPHSPWHCVVGAIHYECVDQDAMPGILVYVKSSLTGDEPADVLEYAARSPEFPHQSTGDQWFDESQFESYRRLGRHVGIAVFETAAQVVGLRESRDKENLFQFLRQQWFPPSEATATSFTRHAQMLDHLFQQLRTDPRLQFLDDQIYPEWRDLMNRAISPPQAEFWLPQNAAELRSGFYFCNSLIQLMQNVYLDLNLEQEYAHPDNRGWMNLFRHWSWSGMFRVAWAISVSGYGARFQAFCERRLDLRVLKLVRVDEVQPDADLPAAGLNFVEIDLVKRFRAYPPFQKSTVCVFRIQVENPVKSSPDPYLFRFNFGFALVHNHQIVCFRVQDHLRRMGLARLALRDLIEQQAVTGLVPDEDQPDSLRSVWEPGERKAFQRLFESVRGAVSG
jgi:hypothetical protein